LLAASRSAGRPEQKLRYQSALTDVVRSQVPYSAFLENALGEGSGCRLRACTATGIAILHFLFVIRPYWTYARA
jgi:hypothetical protein